jgi:hypothetical protein
MATKQIPVAGAIRPGANGEPFKTKGGSIPGQRTSPQAGAEIRRGRQKQGAGKPKRNPPNQQRIRSGKLTARALPKKPSSREFGSTQSTIPKPRRRSL